MTTSAWPPQWQGRWIWPGEAPGEPDPDAHRLAWLRRCFELTSIPSCVPARLTADARFVLHVNGVEVSRGPARSAPERLAYETLDLAPFLLAGRNVIAAEVRFYATPMPWWRRARTGGGELGLGSFAFEAPAIDVVSDATWRGALGRVRLRPASPAQHAPRAEVLDAESQPPRHWMRADFDDSAWTPAVVLSARSLGPDPTVIPGSPYTAPEPSDIGAMTAIALDLEPHDTTTTHTTMHADGMTIASIWLQADGPPGSSVRVTAGEDVAADGTAETAPRHFEVTCELAGDGGPEHFATSDPVGFRFVTVQPRGGARVLAAGAVERRHPHTGAAAFECDDDRLGAIWRAGARTVQVCSTDAFIDCPGREQNAWVGDAYVHALVTMVSNADWRLVRRHLRLAAQALRPDGFLSMIATQEPVGPLACTDYSLHWVRTLSAYHLRSGDRVTARELLPIALRVLDAFEGFRGSDGLLWGIPGVFVDWAMVQRGDVTAAVDALYAAALVETARVTRAVLGSEPLATELEDRAEATRAAFELLWDEPRGVYVDGFAGGSRSRRVSQHTNAAAIIAGCVPAQRFDRVLDAILDDARLKVTPHPATLPVELHWASVRMDPSEVMDFDVQRDVVRAQPFFTHFVHQALVLAGRRHRLADHCLAWYEQVQAGHGTLHEFWSAQPGRASRAHGWSATATYDLTTHLLGVRPLADGFRRAGITPFFGRLDRLRGVVPTPAGDIRVDLARDGGVVTIPDGVSARLAFDDAPLAPRDLDAGTHTITR